MSSQPPIPGILTVNSDVLDPSKLSRTAFDAWYCDEHIPDVVAKSGIASALRYAHVAGTGDPPSKLSFLTIYSMPDINFTSSAEFTSLEGQRPGPARERIFERAEFATRSYALVQSEEGPAAKTGPAKYLHFFAFDVEDEKAPGEELEIWCRAEHGKLRAKCPEYRQMRRYRLASSSVLSGFVRSFPDTPTWLVLREFEGEVDWEALSDFGQGSWGKEEKLVPSFKEVQGGWFELRRVFEKVE